MGGGRGAPAAADATSWPPTEARCSTGFANPRIGHQLAQIAADGSQKLPIRVLPVLRAGSAAGTARPVRVRAGGVDCHLRGAGAPVTDVRAAELVTARGRPARRGARVLAALDPALADDGDLVATVASFVDAIERTGSP